MNTTATVVRKVTGPTVFRPNATDAGVLLERLVSSDLLMAPTAISLFSGLGSFSKALRDLGHGVLAHDFMPEACATLRSNGFPVVQGDVRDVDFTHPIYRRVKVVIGGPPCQPFSAAGRNGGEYDARDMLPDFLRAVAQILPETFMMENVRGLAGPRHKAYLAKVVADAEALGYVVEYRVLDASEYGVPQARKRLFMIGRRLDVVQAEGRAYSIAWPAKVEPVTMAAALGWTIETIVERNQQAPEPARIPGGKFNPALYWPLRRPSTTVVGSFRPECQAAPGYRSTGDGPRQNAPGTVVTTLAERLLLQQMPADWVVCGSVSKQGLQVGNSCPNGLVKALLAPNGAQA